MYQESPQVSQVDYCIQDTWLGFSYLMRPYPAMYYLESTATSVFLQGILDQRTVDQWAGGIILTFVKMPQKL